MIGVLLRILLLGRSSLGSPVSLQKPFRPKNVHASSPEDVMKVPYQWLREIITWPREEEDAYRALFLARKSNSRNRAEDTSPTIAEKENGRGRQVTFDARRKNKNCRRLSGQLVT